MYRLEGWVEVCTKAQKNIHGSLVQHPNVHNLFTIDFVHAFQNEYVPTNEDGRQKHLQTLNSGILLIYKKALVDLCSNFSLMYEYAHKKNKDNLLNHIWKADSKGLTDEVTEYESDLMKRPFKDDMRILSRIGNFGLNNTNLFQKDKIQNLFTEMIFLYPETGIVDSMIVSKETREWWTIENVEEVADFVNNPVLAEKLKYCQRLFKIWETESVLIMTEDNPTNQIVMRNTMSDVKKTEPECAYLNFMLMMTVQVHNVAWIIH